MPLIFVIFASIIVTRFLFAGDQMTELPVTIESKVVWVEDKSFLLVKIINKFPESIIISKDFLNSSFWDIWILEEDVKKGETNIRRLPQVRKFGTRPSFKEQLDMIKRRIKFPEKNIELEPNESYQTKISLEYVLDIAKAKNPVSFSIIAQLEFTELILQVPNINDVEIVELFLTKFYTPSFIFDDGKWRPFGQKNIENESNVW